MPFQLVMLIRAAELVDYGHEERPADRREPGVDLHLRPDEIASQVELVDLERFLGERSRVAQDVESGVRVVDHRRRPVGVGDGAAERVGVVGDRAGVGARLCSRIRRAARVRGHRAIVARCRGCCCRPCW